MIDVTERLHGPDGIEAAREILRLRSENEKLRLENDKLREALKPFTLLLETDDETHSRIVGSPLLSDLHRARALLNGENR